jgi:hypothetical protein
VADLSGLDIARDVQLVFAVTNGVRRESAAVAVRAADDRPAAAAAAGTPGRTKPGGVDTLPREQRGVLPPVTTPGGTDLLPGDDRGDVLTPGTLTPGGTDLLPSDEHGDVLKPGTVTPGGVDLLPDLQRGRRGRPFGATAGGVRPPAATPGGTDLLPGDDRGDVLTPGTLTPGGTDLLPSDDHGDVLKPGTLTPGGVDLLPGRFGARRDPFRDGGLQRWTALATFPYAGLDIIAFNAANRLALTTLTTFPAPLSWLDLSGFVQDIEIATFEGTLYALVAMGPEGIAVVDVDDPAQPVLVAQVRVSYGAEGLSFAGAADATAFATVNALATDGATLWIGDADYGLKSTELEQLLGRAGAFR